MNLIFEWDEEKASGNLEKHGISFEEASTVFADSLSLTIADPLHSFAEPRFILSWVNTPQLAAYREAHSASGAQRDFHLQQACP